MLGKDCLLDHVAIAVDDLEKAVETYEAMGVKFQEEREIIESQGVKTAFAQVDENAQLELLGAYGEGGPISKFLENHPAGGLHHFCLTTNDVSEAAATANNSGMRVLGGDTLTIGHHGKKLFFIHPKDTLGSLIEIEEIPSKDN